MRARICNSRQHVGGVQAGPRAGMQSGSKRSYATPAAQTADFQVSATSSGIKLATLDEGLPTSAITVAVKAGARYESQPGLSHVLKNFVFKVRTFLFQTY